MNDFARLLRAGDVGKVLERVEAVLATGVSVEQFASDLAEYFRSLLLVKNGISRDTLLGYAPEDFDMGVVGSLSAPQVEKALELLLSLYRGLRFSLNQRFELELCLARLAELDRLITPAEVREAIGRIRGEVAAAPGATVTPAPPGEPRPAAAVSGAAPAVSAPPPADAGTLVSTLIDSFRREKPSLSSWLEKRATAAIEAGELHLAFSARDRFAGEQILRERDLVSERISKVLGTPLKLRVSFMEAKEEAAGSDPRVEMVRKVFRGEVVKGEGHGSEPL
jgi:DNA polymerase III gamma/tau subunit